MSILMQLHRRQRCPQNLENAQKSSKEEKEKSTTPTKKQQNIRINVQENPSRGSLIN